MAGERAEDYLWALRHTKRLFSELLVVPKTFVTDRELTLMNTLSTVYVDDDNVKFLCASGTSEKIFLPENERPLQALQP